MKPKTLGAKKPAKRWQKHPNNEDSELERLLGILRHLRGRSQPTPMKQFEDTYKVTQRQIRRDIDKLTRVGYHIDTTPALNEKGRPMAAMRLVEEDSAEIDVTFSERVSLLILRTMCEPFKGTPLYDDVIRLWEKATATLSKKEREELETFGERIVYIPAFGTKSYEGMEDIFNALWTGIMKRWAVKYRYKSPKGKREMGGTFAPHALLIYADGLYVAGRRLRNVEDGKTPPDDDEPPVTLAAERFLEAEHVRGAGFAVPRRRIASHYEGALGVFPGKKGAKPITVEIEFAPESAPEYLEQRSWLRSQRFEQLPDGRGTLMRFEVTDLTPVPTFVLRWGRLARVIAPAELVDIMRSETAAMGATYHAASPNR